MLIFADFVCGGKCGGLQGERAGTSIQIEMWGYMCKLTERFQCLKSPQQFHVLYFLMALGILERSNRISPGFLR